MKWFARNKDWDTVWGAPQSLHNRPEKGRGGGALPGPHEAPSPARVGSAGVGGGLVPVMIFPSPSIFPFVYTKLR